MKQLASTFTEGKLRYYLADSESDEIEEVAIIKPGPGFGGDPSAMVTLGFGLLHEAGYNGHKKGAGRQPALVAERPVQQALPPALPFTRKRKPAGTYKVTVEDIIEYLREHPGSRPSEIGQALLPAAPRQRQGQTITNRVGSYFRACEKAGIRPVLHVDRQDPHHTHYYVIGNGD